MGHVGWGGSCRSGVGHALWLMQGWGWSWRHEVGHVGVEWVIVG